MTRQQLLETYPGSKYGRNQIGNQVATKFVFLCIPMKIKNPGSLPGSVFFWQGRQDSNPQPTVLELIRYVSGCPLCLTQLPIFGIFRWQKMDATNTFADGFLSFFSTGLRLSRPVFPGFQQSMGKK